VHSPEVGYPAIQRLVANREQFTAVVAFNDMSAIGIIRALQDLGIQVPSDVSVIGFDDITAASYNFPRLTTIRQPLSEMGKIAARCVLSRLHGTEKFGEEITVEPNLVVRESTQVVGRPRARTPGRKLPAVRRSVRR
jgi:LacI family transcriptional regulator